MGIWGAIKYALNSTLGTSGFKPLDQLLTDDITAHIENYVGKASTLKENQLNAHDKFLANNGVSTDYTLLSVNNNGGFVHGIMLLNSSSVNFKKPSTLTINVDGIDKYTFTEVCTTGHSKYFNAVTSNFIYSFPSETSPLHAFISRDSSDGVIYGPTQLGIAMDCLQRAKADDVNSPGINGAPVYLFDKPIRFNESVSIILNTKADSNWINSDIYYSLDE